MVIPLGRSLPGGSCDQLGTWIRRGHVGGLPRGSYSVLHQVGFAMPLPSPGERCALTTPFHPCRTPRLPAKSGGLFSVALSFESPRLVVNQHPAQGARTFPRRRQAPSRPSAELQREAEGSIAAGRTRPRTHLKERPPVSGVLTIAPCRGEGQPPDEAGEEDPLSLSFIRSSQ